MAGPVKFFVEAGDILDVSLLPDAATLAGAPLAEDMVTDAFAPFDSTQPTLMQAHVYRLTPGTTVYFLTDAYMLDSGTDPEGALPPGTKVFSETSHTVYVFEATGSGVTYASAWEANLLPDVELDASFPADNDTDVQIREITAPSSPGEYYLVIYGVGFAPTDDGTVGAGRYLLTTSNVGTVDKRNAAWGEDWLQRLPEGELFSPDDDTVDFNNLTEEQKGKIDDLLDDPNTLDEKLYSADAGNDEVQLPEADKLQLTDEVVFDPFKIFDAGDGNDTIHGSGHRDIVVGGKDDDSLEGMGGNDRLSGGAGNDEIEGGDGHDVLSGNVDLEINSTDGDAQTLAGVHLVIELGTGASGEDSEQNTIRGGDGDDLLFGHVGSDTIIGGTGRDKLLSGAGDDFIIGGVDTEFDDDAPDEIFAGSGNDTIYTGREDTLYFGEPTKVTLEVGNLSFAILRANDGSSHDEIYLLDASTNFDFFDGTGQATYNDLLNIVRDRDEITATAEELQTQVDKLFDVNHAVQKIDNALALIDEGISDANQQALIDSLIAIGGALNIVKAGDKLINSGRLAKELGETGVSKLNASESALKLGASDGEKIYREDRDAEDMLLFGASILTIALTFINPVLGGAMAWLLAANATGLAWIDRADRISELRAELSDLRVDLTEELIDRDALAKLVDGMVQHLMDKTGEARGLPNIRLIGDEWESADVQPVLQQAIEALGGSTSASMILDKGSTVTGADGNDVLHDAAGAAFINTGKGEDLLVAFGPTGNVDLGSGNDILVTSGNLGSANGGEGNDALAITPEEGAVLLPGAAEFVGFEKVGFTLDSDGMGPHDYEFDADQFQFGGNTSDTLTGDASSELLSGGGGNDTLLGQDGDDFLEGGAGSDSVVGGAGSDRLAGGSGDDHLTGGIDEDIFVAVPDGSLDVVTDFEHGVDLIDLRSFSSQVAIDAIENARQGSVILDFPDGTTLHIEGAEFATFGLDDVILSNASPDGQPAIEGEAVQGEVLVADVSGVSDDDGIDPATESFQWQRDGIDIPGAEGSSYTLTQEDVQKQITVVYSYTDTFGTPESVTGAPTAPVENVNDPIQGFIVLTGTPAVGETLTADGSGITDEDGIVEGSITWGWYRLNQSFQTVERIPGADQATYTVTEDDRGYYISPRFTYEDEFGGTGVRSGVGVYVNAPPSGDVMITGLAEDGQTLTVDISGINEPDTIRDNTLTYQWRRDGVDIVDANDTTYEVTSDDVGFELSVHVTYLDGGNTREELTSAAVAITDAPQPQVLTGTPDPDVLTAGDGNDTLRGLGSNDTLTGSAGNDLIDGGPGRDTAIYSGDQASYTLTLSPTSATLADRRADGNGTDQLIDIEFLDFETEIPALGGNPMNLEMFGGPTNLSEEQFGDLIELYIAYFNRAPDSMGLYFWATAYADGQSLEEIAALFSTAAETKALYPDGSSNEIFLENVYNNVLGRLPDQGGFDFWLGHLNSGALKKETFILDLLGGAQGSDVDYLNNKVDIGTYFAVIKGMSNGRNGSEVMELFDGTQQSIEEAIAAADQFHAEALDPDDGEFLMPLVGVVDDPFAIA